MIATTRFRPLLILFAFVLFAAACSSGSSDGDTSVATNDGAPASADDSDSAAAPDEPDTPDDEPDSDSDEPSMAASSPIGAFFAGDGGFEAAINEYTTRVEEAIVVCMAEQGFEFKPTGAQQNEVQERQNDLTVREWTEEYGYGISTSFDSIAQQQANDPNSEILFSLSASERDIWLQTLLGSSFDDPTAGEDGADLENQGCIGASIIETGGQGVIEGLEEFGEAYEKGEAVIYDTNEMIVAVGDWTRCMSEAGFPDYSDLDSPEDDIGRQLDDITRPLDAALDELDPEEGRALVEGDVLDLESLPGLDVDALRALQETEKKTAITDLDCYEVHVRDVFEPLRNDFERGLMDTYGSELDALANIGG